MNEAFNSIGGCFKEIPDAKSQKISTNSSGAKENSVQTEFYFNFNDQGSQSKFFRMGSVLPKEPKKELKLDLKGQIGSYWMTFKQKRENNSSRGHSYKGSWDYGIKVQRNPSEETQGINSRFHQINKENLVDLGQWTLLKTQEKDKRKEAKGANGKEPGFFGFKEENSLDFKRNQQNISSPADVSQKWHQKQYERPMEPNHRGIHVSRSTSLLNQQPQENLNIILGGQAPDQSLASQQQKKHKKNDHSYLIKTKFLVEDGFGSLNKEHSIAPFQNNEKNKGEPATAKNSSIFRVPMFETINDPQKSNTANPSPAKRDLVANSHWIERYFEAKNPMNEETTAYRGGYRTILNSSFDKNPIFSSYFVQNQPQREFHQGENTERIPNKLEDLLRNDGQGQKRKEKLEMEAKEKKYSWMSQNFLNEKAEREKSTMESSKQKGFVPSFGHSKAKFKKQEKNSGEEDHLKWDLKGNEEKVKTGRSGSYIGLIGRTERNCNQSKGNLTENMVLNQENSFKTPEINKFRTPVAFCQDTTPCSMNQNQGSQKHSNQQQSLASQSNYAPALFEQKRTPQVYGEAGVERRKEDDPSFNKNWKRNPGLSKLLGANQKYNHKGVILAIPQLGFNQKKLDVRSATPNISSMNPKRETMQLYGGSTYQRNGVNFI